MVSLLLSDRDAAEAVGLPELMTRAVEQMLEVQAALEEFSREAGRR